MVEKNKVTLQISEKENNMMQTAFWKTLCVTIHGGEEQRRACGHSEYSINVCCMIGSAWRNTGITWENEEEGRIQRTIQSKDGQVLETDKECRLKESQNHCEQSGIKDAEGKAERSS